MTKTSIIQYPPESPIVIIRAALVAICPDAPDPNCAAGILNQMIYWTDIRLAHADQADYFNAAAEADGLPEAMDDNLWIYKTQDDLQAELLKLFGRNKIIDTLSWLVSVGYLERRNNPRYRWDRTAQYRLVVEAVQSRISALPSFKTKRSKRGNQTIKHASLNAGLPGNKPAIPEITSKTTTEDGSRDLSAAVTAYERNIGMRTEIIDRELTGLFDDYGGAWLYDAIHHAVVQEKRSLGYVKGTLVGWKREGRGAKTNGSKAGNGSAKAGSGTKQSGFDEMTDVDGNKLFQE